MITVICKISIIDENIYRFLTSEIIEFKTITNKINDTR